MHDTFEAIAAGCSDAFLAAFLHVTTRTIQNWRRGRPEAPYSARALLWLRLGGDMAEIWGKGWEGFRMRPEALFHPFWREGFTPGDLRGFFYRMQLMPRLERDIEELRAELARLMIERACRPVNSDDARRPASSFQAVGSRAAQPRERRAP